MLHIANIGVTIAFNSISLVLQSANALNCTRFDCNQELGHWIPLHCIALHCIVLHCIALHCIVLYPIALHYSVSHCIALCCNQEGLQHQERVAHSANATELALWCNTTTRAEFSHRERWWRWWRRWRGIILFLSGPLPEFLNLQNNFMLPFEAD